MQTHPLSAFALVLSSALLSLAGCGGAVDSDSSGPADGANTGTDAQDLGLLQGPVLVKTPLDIFGGRPPVFSSSVPLLVSGPLNLQPTPDRNSHVNRHLFHTLSGAALETIEHRYMPIPNEFCPSDMVTNPTTTVGGTRECPNCTGFGRDIGLPEIVFGAKNQGPGYSGHFRIELTRLDETSVLELGATGPSYARQETVVATVDSNSLAGGSSSSPLFRYDPQTTVRVWSFPTLPLPLGACFVEVNKYDNPNYQENGYRVSVDTLDQEQETLETDNTATIVN